MGHLMYEILNNRISVYFIWGFCILSFVLFIIYALSKEGRDEHGKAILGTSCFYGAIVLFITMNIFTQFTYTVTSNVIIFSNSIRLVFISFFLTVDIAIAILRKIR